MHRFNPINEQRKKTYTMIPKTSVLNKKKKKDISYQEQLDEHTVSVKYILFSHCVVMVTALLSYGRKLWTLW